MSGAINFQGSNGPYWDFASVCDPRYRPTWFPTQADSVRINDVVRKSVVFLGFVTPAGQFVPLGTGFIVAVKIGADNLCPYLVTAKHVIEDAQTSGLQIVARLNLKSGGSALGLAPGPWWHHPTDKKCDIAVTGFLASVDTFDFMAVDMNDRLTQKYIDENDVGAGDEVFTSGLLVRHFGRDRNIPIVRTGNIAAMPEEPTDLGSKLGRQEVYLIESRSIGGLSGSPVFLNTPPHRIRKDHKIVDAAGHNRDYLLGINIGLFEAGAHADRVPTDEQLARDRFLETMSAGIAVVVPIERVMEILNSDVLKKNREEIVDELSKNPGFVPSSASVPVVTPVEPATDNPFHKEDFTHLLGTASKAKPPAS